MSDVGSLPASLNARRMENIGSASNTKAATDPSAARHGWRWTTRLHRYQKPRSEPPSERFDERRTENRSIEWPANPSIAGNSVSDPINTSTTDTMAPADSPIM